MVVLDYRLRCLELSGQAKSLMYCSDELTGQLKSVSLLGYTNAEIARGQHYWHLASPARNHHK